MSKLSPLAEDLWTTFLCDADILESQLCSVLFKGELAWDAELEDIVYALVAGVIFKVAKKTGSQLGVVTQGNEDCFILVFDIEKPIYYYSGWWGINRTTFKNSRDLIAFMLHFYIMLRSKIRDHQKLQGPQETQSASASL